MLLVVFIGGLVSSAVITPKIKEMLIKGGALKKNYEGIEIPVGMGIALVPILIINSFFALIMKAEAVGLFVFQTGILTMAFVGIIDDLMGNRDDSGFRGHIGGLLRGRLTTGGFKAVTGGMVGLLISAYISDGILNILINTLLIGMMTNLLNLFDLRPGRALKVYFIIGILLLLSGITYESKLIFYMVLGFWLIYLPQDLKARAMLGDAGSNSLGVILGITAALSLSTAYRLVIILLLAGIHIAAEKYSLTKIIKGNIVLDFLDRLGR